MSVFRRSFVVLAIVWVMLLPVAAFAASRRPSGSSTAGYALAFAVYWIGRVICHQRPERSFHLFAVQMPVCARCTGIYAGAAVAAMAMAFRGADALRVANRSRATSGPSFARLRWVDARALSAWVAGRVLLASVLPGAATLVYEWSTGHMPTHWVRAMSGVPLGAAVAWIVCRAAPDGREGM